MLTIINNVQSQNVHPSMDRVNTKNEELGINVSNVMPNLQPENTTNLNGVKAEVINNHRVTSSLGWGALRAAGAGCAYLFGQVVPYSAAMSAAYFSAMAESTAIIGATTGLYYGTLWATGAVGAAVVALGLLYQAAGRKEGIYNAASFVGSILKAIAQKPALLSQLTSALRNSGVNDNTKPEDIKPAQLADFVDILKQNSLLDNHEVPLLLDQI